MDIKNETENEKITKEVKEFKQEKTKEKLKQDTEKELIISYAQLAFHTLKNSATEITPKAIREEIKMFYDKFGNTDVRKMANSIVKEKKEKK